MVSLRMAKEPDGEIAAGTEKLHDCAIERTFRPQLHFGHLLLTCATRLD